MAKVLLITRPDYDRATHYLYHWSIKGIEAAEEHDFKVVQLEKEAANRKEFDGRNSKLNPVLIIFNGHGNSTCITGQHDDILVELNKNDHQFGEKIIYAISCSAAKVLGRSMVQKKAISFIGYEEDFILHTHKDMETRPLDDPVAKFFLEHSQIFITALVKGNTIGQAYEKARENLRGMVTTAFYSDPTMAADLYSNYINFIPIGDVDHRFS
jgi:hypothetical protein